jgi:hypothetical protein
MEQSPSSETDGNSASQGIPAFMEQEGSLPCSQESATCPYLEPDESSHIICTIYLKSALLLSP